MSTVENPKVESGKSGVWADGQTRIPKNVQDGLELSDGDRLHWQTTGDGEARVIVESDD